MLSEAGGRKARDRTIFAETGWRVSAQQASTKNLGLSISLFGFPDSRLLNLQLPAELAMSGYELPFSVASSWDPDSVSYGHP